MKEQRSNLKVGGIEYEWWVSRQPQWCHENGWRGVEITVKPCLRPSRALLLQFPFSVSSRKSTPHRQRPKISPKEVARNIQNAIATGWEPESKGKSFRYEVECST